MTPLTQKLSKLKEQAQRPVIFRGWVPLAVLFKLIVINSGVLGSHTVYAQQSPTPHNNEVEMIAWVGEQPADFGVQSPIPQFSVNEQVILTIEVATPRWFTTGTRIGGIDIQNVIAKQRNPLATNYTERKGGQIWSRQRWEITIYPQVSGLFVIPPVAVDVSVSASDGSTISGTLYTQPISFQAVMPSGLLNQELAWFSATEVEIQQQWQTSRDTLQAGDTITRKITLHAQDSLSVLLPDLRMNESTSRYQVYPHPNRFDDRQVRGDYQSSRIAESVYVIQQGGELTLPAYSFQWWNSNTKQLQKVMIEGKTFQVRHTVTSFLKTYSIWFSCFFGGVVILVIVITGVWRYYRARPIPPWLTLQQLLKAQRWGEARTVLYKQLHINTTLLEMSKADNDNNWLARSARLQQGEKNIRLLKLLWRAIQRKRPKRWKIKVPKALPQLDDI